MIPTFTQEGWDIPPFLIHLTKSRFLSEHRIQREDNHCVSTNNRNNTPTIMIKHRRKHLPMVGTTLHISLLICE